MLISEKGAIQLQSMPLADMRPRKILHFYLDFGALGGIEHYIINVSKAIKAQEGFEVVVACSSHSDFYQRLKQEGMQVCGVKTCILFKKPAFRIFDVPTWLQMAAILKKEKPDLVHVHIGQVENLFFKLFRMPMVYSFHGYGKLYSHQEPQHQFKRYIKRILRYLFRLQLWGLDALLFVSKAEQRRMIKEGYVTQEKAGQVLHNGLPIGTIQRCFQQMDKNALRQKWNIPKEIRCVLFINRLDENKNPLLFIRVAERLCQDSQLQSLHFVIAGSGPLESKVKQAIEQSPYKNYIHSVGFVHQPLELIACADLVVHVPRMEGFGFGVLEAMAVGTLCLAYDTGGIGELLAPFRKRLLVPSGDVERLVEKAKILLSLSSEEKQQLVFEVQHHARRYEEAPFMHQLMEVYKHVLS